MHTRSRKRFVLIILSISVGLVGVVGRLPIAASEATAERSLDSRAPSEAELSRVATSILAMSSKLESDFPDVFGGMYELTNEVSVIRVVDIESPRAQKMIEFAQNSVEDSLARVGRAVQFRFESYPVAYERVRSALNRVTELMDDDRFGIISAGIGIDGVMVGVETDGDVEELRKLLVGDIPDVTFDVRVEVPPETTADRYSDSPPWNGGDMLAISIGGTPQYHCSSGPGAHDSQGNRYLLMAAHCGMNFFCNTNFGSPNLNNPVGPMTARTYANNYPDAGIITTNSSRYFWEGPGPGVRRTTLAPVDPVLGMQVCGQGVTTATYGSTNCGAVAVVNSCVFFQGEGLTFCGLFRWDGSASIGGDSGGYISYASIYGYGAVGTITGSRANPSQSFGTPVAYHGFLWGLTLNTPSTP